MFFFIIATQKTQSTFSSKTQRKQSARIPISVPQDPKDDSDDGGFQQPKTSMVVRIPISVPQDPKDDSDDGGFQQPKTSTVVRIPISVPQDPKDDSDDGG